MDLHLLKRWGHSVREIARMTGHARNAVRPIPERRFIDQKCFFTIPSSKEIFPSRAVQFSRRADLDDFQTAIAVG